MIVVVVAVVVGIDFFSGRQCSQNDRLHNTRYIFLLLAYCFSSCYFSRFALYYLLFIQFIANVPIVFTLLSFNKWKKKKKHRITWLNAKCLTVLS